MTTFGLYAAIGDPPRGERLQQCIDEVCAEAQLAEEVGFDAILVGEHHQHRDGFLPSPLIVSRHRRAQIVLAVTRLMQESAHSCRLLPG